ncbi:MAG: hypothetical protein WDN44_11645 [Sphingomonas sp.]
MAGGSARLGVARAGKSGERIAHQRGKEAFVRRAQLGQADAMVGVLELEDQPAGDRPPDRLGRKTCGLRAREELREPGNRGR